MPHPTDHECGSCCEVMSGYTRSELEAEGWVWHVKTKGRASIVVFVMCRHCTEVYEKRRAAHK